MRAVRPWRSALREERCLPDGVRGPVEWRELARLVEARGEDGVGAWGFGRGAVAFLRASQRKTGSVGVGIVGAWAVVAIGIHLGHRDSTGGDGTEGRAEVVG